MWCHECGQDVPGLGRSPDGSPTCARCGTALAESLGGESLAGAAQHGLDLATAPRAGYDAWQLDEDVRRLQARLGTWRRLDAAHPRNKIASADATKSTWRIDAAHPRTPKRHRPPKKAPVRRASRAARAILSLGTITFGFGAGLLVWSLVETRPELWNIGLPIAAVGQVTLLLALAVQLERIWRQNRDNAEQLARVERRLVELRRTAAQANVTHGTAAQAFYSHLADEAHPQMLLADLKGQMDLLAERFSRP